MKKDRKIFPKIRKNEKGMSLLESLPLILVLASLIGFLLGLWGMTHKSILHSIAARNNAFRVFNHRANLIYYSDTDKEEHSYLISGLRFFTVAEKPSGSDGFYAFTTPMRFPSEEPVNEPSQLHTTRIWEEGRIPINNEAILGTKQPWIMVAYGICLNSGCGE